MIVKFVECQVMSVGTLKKYLKKVCKKQARKAFDNQPCLTKKSAKKNAKRLAKKIYRLLKKELSVEAKSKIKHSVNTQLNHLLAMKSSQNDCNYNISTIEQSSNLLSTIDLSQPFKKKPCSSCPALKNGLCKCAIKAQHDPIAI